MNYTNFRRHKKLNKNNQISMINKILERRDNYIIEHDIRNFIEQYELDEDVIRMLFTYMPRPWWNYIVQNQKMSEDLIREFQDKLDMLCVGTNQIMSEEFLEEMKDRISFRTIPRYHKLSEDFIRRHAEELEWRYVSRDQYMSDEFLEEYVDKIVWIDYFYRNANVDELNEAFIWKHLDDIFSDGDVAHSFLWKRSTPLSKNLKKEILKKRSD